MVESPVVTNYELLRVLSSIDKSMRFVVCKLPDGETLFQIEGVVFFKDHVELDLVLPGMVTQLNTVKDLILNLSGYVFGYPVNIVSIPEMPVVVKKVYGSTKEYTIDSISHGPFTVLGFKKYTLAVILNLKEKHETKVD